MIGQMTAGNFVDYIISYNKINEEIYKKDGKKEVKVRKANQSDFDRF